MATYNLYGATSNGINLDSRLNYVPEGGGPPPAKVPSGADIVNQNPAGEFFYTHQGVSFSSFTGRGGSLVFGTMGVTGVVSAVGGVVSGELAAGTWQNAGYVRQNGVAVAGEVFGAGLQDIGTITADDVHLATSGIYISNGSVTVNGTLTLPGSLTSEYGIALSSGISGDNTYATGGVLQTNTIYAPDEHQPLGILISDQGTLSVANFEVYSSHITINYGSTLAIAGPLAIGKDAGDTTKISISGTNSTLTAAGNLVIGDGGVGSLSLSGGASETWSGVTLAAQAGASGYLGVVGGGAGTILHDLSSGIGTGRIVVNDGSLSVGGNATIGNAATDAVTVTGAAANWQVGGDIDLGVSASGTGAVTVSNEGTVMSGGALDIGEMPAGSSSDTLPQDFGSGSVTVDGTLSTVQVADLTVGGAVPTPTNESAHGNGTYAGGIGWLTISNGGTVSVDGTLALLARVQAGADATSSAQGGIEIVSDGSLEVGGRASAPANTLQVDAGGQLIGHGLIASTVTGQTAVGATATTPTYSLTVDNGGTIEADQGGLVIHADVTGDGQFLVANDSTLEFGGSVAAADVTAMFLPGGNSTIAIDDPENFQGVISSENFEPGDKIDLPNVSYVSPGPNDSDPDGASFYFETGEQQPNYVLQIVEGGQTYNIPISKDEQWTGGFTLSDDGHGGTLITHTAGQVTDYSDTAIADGRLASYYAGVVKITFPTSVGRISVGSGFAIAPHLVLTALHVVGPVPLNPKIHTITPNTFVTVTAPGRQSTIGMVLKDVSGKVTTVNIPNARSINDYAFVWVPGLNFTNSQYFQLNNNFSGGQVIVTGYPAGKEGQYTNIGSVSPQGPYLIPKDNTLWTHGNSGGPLWEYIPGAPTAVGIVSLTTSPTATQTIPYAINVNAIPQYNVSRARQLAGASAFFDPPPSTVAQVTSAFVLQSGDADTGQTVEFLLNMSENVVVAGGGPTLSLNNGGTATYDAMDSTGTELVFGYTVGAGDQTSNLKITQLNSGQTVQGPGGASIDFSVFDNIPTGLSINSPLVVTSVAGSETGEVAAGQLVQLTLTMNAAVTVNTSGGAPTLTLNDNVTATYDSAASNPSARTLVFDYAVGSGDETADLQVASVDIPSGTTVQNAAGYNADFAAAIDAPTGLQVGPAYVIAITPSQSSGLTTGQTVQLSLAMSQGVIVNTTAGSPTLSLSDGATAAYDSADSNPSSGNLVFNYTVGSGDYTTDLQVLSYNANGATVMDAHGVKADFSAAAQSDLALDVDATTLTNLTVSPSAGEADSGQQVTLSLTMSEAVTVNLSGGSPTLGFNDGGTATYDSVASNSSAGSLVFAYRVGATDETPSLQVSQVNLNGATIDDGNGNAADLSAAGNFTTNLQIGPAFVSSVTPSLTGAIFTGQTDQLTLAMSQAVTVNTTKGSPTLSLSDGAIATYDGAASDPSTGTLVFDYTVGAGDYAIGLTVVGYNANGATVTDANGVNAHFSAVAQSALDLDVNAAIVTNVTSSPSSGEADSGQSITVTLTMSEAVTVNTTNSSPTLSLSTGATATYDSGASNPSAGTLVFDYTVGATDETPNLQVIQANLNGATINDANGNTADLSAAANFDTGLQVGPVSVDSVTPALSGDITTGQTVQLTVSMSAGLTVNTANGSPTLSLTDGAAATYDTAASAPSAGTLVFDYTVGAGDYATGLSVVGFNANGASVTDANGVSPDFSGLAESYLGLDVNAAIVTNVTASPSASEADSGQQVLLTLAMNESVTVNTAGGSPSLDLSDGATATYDAAASNPAAGTLVFTYTVGATDEDSNLQIGQVNLDGATINDANGNAADLSAATTIATNLQIGPVFVNSLTPSVTGEATQGQTVQLTMAMSAGVTLNLGVGLPTLTLSNGATAAYDQAYSGPAAGALVFVYGVGANQQASDLEVTSVNLNGSSIEDSNGVNVDFSAALDTPIGLSVGAPAQLAGEVTVTVATEGMALPATTTIATFTDSNTSDSASNFTATINWGDGTATAGMVSGSNGSFAVAGGHVYADEGSNTLAVTITDTLNISTITPSGTVAVGEGDTLVPNPVTFSASVNTPFSGEVASFTDTTYPDSVAGDFNATINWGDGSPPTTVMVGGGNGSPFTVAGSHTYTEAGTDTVAVTLNDDPPGTATATADSTAIIGAVFTPNPPPPAATTADMILRDGSNGNYEIYDLGNNQILGAGPLGQVGTDYVFAGLGDFNGADTTDMLLRSTSTGTFEVYDIGNNNITAAAALGQVGLEWQVAGFGNFNGPRSGTDMMLRDTSTGAFEVYDIANNAITSASAFGQVGLEWQVAGFGDFSSNPNETDMLLRNINTGSFEVYDINDSKLISASNLGQVGLEWQVAGFGDFSGNANEIDMLLRNVNTGAFELYDIQNNQITSASAVGQVGLEWQVAGFGPLNGAGTSDMVLRDSQTGAFEVYDFAKNQLTGAASLGQVGSEWAVGGFAPDPLTILVR